jgi:protein gp37
MADGTKIEWADATVNAINGCSVTSPGCTHCYAMKLAGTRMRDHPTRQGLTIESKAGPVWNGEVRLHKPALLQPLSWTKPRRIFWNAHGDTFHPNVPWEWTAKVMAAAFLSPQHIHMILTKRADRMNAWFDTLATEGYAEDFSAIIEDLAESAGIECDYPEWTLPLDNVWLGVSVEDQTRADERIPDLLDTPAAVRFLSCEPLLGPVDLTDLTLRVRPEEEPSGLAGLDALTGVHWDAHDTIVGIYGNPDPRIDWVIAGGESGPGARPMHPDWARSLRDQCADADVPFHFKQWGNWAPVCEMDEQLLEDIYHPAPKHSAEASRRCKVDQCVLHADGTRFNGKQMYEREAFWQGKGAMTMFEVGKKRAGRLLDGVEHNGMPEVQHG